MTEAKMEIASSTIDITPTKPAFMGASGKYTRPAVKVESPLEANILALRDGTSDNTLVLVSLDLLYTGPTITKSVRDHLISRKNTHVILLASHTHRAPMTDDGKPRLGSYNEEYVSRIIPRLTNAIDDCLSRMTPITLTSASTATGDLTINRRLRKRLVVARKIRLNGIVNAPNRDGERDETLTTVAFRDRNGLACIMWNLACHPVGHPESDIHSPHYPGRVRDALRERFGKSVPIVFIQGYSGNVRPSGTSEVHTINRKIRQLLSGRLFEDFHQNGYVAWCDKVAKTAERSLTSHARVDIDSIAIRTERRPASQFITASPGVFELSRVSLGSQVEIVAASGELMVEHGQMLRGILPAKYVIPAGCANDVIGYLPTPAIQEEGGYEAGEFTNQFGLGPIQSNAAQLLDDMLERISSNSPAPDQKKPASSSRNEQE